MKLKCSYEKPIYEDAGEDGSGYMVELYSLTDFETEGNEKCPIETGSTFVAVGYYLSKLPKTTILLTGNWKKDAKRGLQFIVMECSEIVEKTEFGITSFLSSGLIKGIGKGLASRIYKTFKEQTIDILDNDINRLIEVSGISKSKLEKIKESYKLVSGSRELITFLGNYKVKPKVAQKVSLCKITLTDIKENPYSILKVKGIGFPTADLINMGLNLSYHSPNRICAAVTFCLKINEQNGHCGMKKDDLVDAIYKTLNLTIKDGPVTMDEIAQQIILMVDRKEVIPVKGIYFRAEMYWAECDVAKEIIRLMSHPVEPIAGLVDKLKEWEKDKDVVFDPIQEKAVMTALTYGFSVITGGPGRGKTTVAKAIVELRERYGSKKTVQLMAPTGRASKRLSDSTGEAATTIHSGLRISDDEEANEQVCAEQLLIDEVSMVDIWLMRTLLKAVPDGCNVTLIGDYNQLPSVKAGAVLRDIIASKVVPVVELLKVYRQAEGSTVVENAEKINKGDTKLVINDEFQCYKAMDGKTAAKTMIYLYKQAIKTYGRKEVALLSPFHHAKSEASSDSVNAYLQEILNKGEEGKKEMVYRNRPFRVGDIVMQTQNKNEICNGDIGVVTDIHFEDGELVMEVAFDGSNIVYEYTAPELEIVELAYCMTYHKSQGSEYECVIGCLLDEHKRMLKRNLLYTGVTRAKKCFEFVGSPTALNTAILTVDTETRITLLSEKIVYAFKQAVKDNPFLQQAS